MITNEERDSAGRHPGAPAWDGDLTALSPAGLEQHDDGLVRAIANLTLLYSPQGPGVASWKVRTPAQRSVDGWEKWVSRLAVVRNERDRREQELGGLDKYISLYGTPAFEEPWSSDRS